MLYLDPSALIRRYVEDEHSAWVRHALAADPTWCISALGRTELLVALRDVAAGPLHLAEMRSAIHADWASLVVVPVDDRCLARAAEIGSTFRLRITDAVHLAAADRLPDPVALVTLERRQIAAAGDLGLEVRAPTTT